MSSENENGRYVFRTAGVCPPEIHFRLEDGRVRDVRFVGGGCPGNAALVGKLLENRELNEALGLLGGIECRNGTSCPDQLAQGLTQAVNGSLPTAGSFRVREIPAPLEKIGIIAAPTGRLDLLQAATAELRSREGVEEIICLGDLTAGLETDSAVIKFIRKEKLIGVTGPADLTRAALENGDGSSGLTPRDRDDLLQMPQVLSFRLGDRPAMVFYGQYILDMDGFSDFEPFALEMNMVCGLSDFLRDEDVLPAVEAMTPQFTARIVVFGQTGQWDRKSVGDVDFISVGRLDGDVVRCQVLEAKPDGPLVARTVDVEV